jgi:eukaryotic-like serine/threonine-protein kinase
VIDPSASDRLTRVAAILDEIIDCPAAERAARLDAQCGGDPALRAAVEAVLQHDVADDTPFLAAVGEALDAAGVGAASATTGQRLGPYRLVREIGRGGMGAVYLATRVDEEFEQQVAIKVIGGLLAPHVLQRFRAERQILASLAHPNIARLLDGGTTADGVPYLVMEHVDGVPIDQYCRDHGLSARARLTLMLQVCDAVSYAHRSLVIHRDLKPGNILVTNDGAPKLLDFGIAKLLDTGGAAAPVTNTLEHLLTPEYASPEQVRAEPITTATDVYSLGILLYELLTGKRPHQFKTRRPDEIARVVCDEEATRPSTVLAREARESGGAAAAVPIRPRELAGDLDTILLTALQKEPARRYASADALADDIRRHFAGEPLRARPATLGYRTTRFVRRHRLAVAAAAVLVTVLSAWAVTLTVQARRIARERDTALQVTSFLVDLFASSDPTETRSADITARELLDRGAARLTELKDRPEIKVRMLDAIAKVYRSLGASNRAEPLLVEALRLHESDGGPATAEAAVTANELAEALRELGKNADAEAMARRALATRERIFGPRSVEAAQSKNTLGLLMRARGKYADAEPLFREAVAIWRATLGAQHTQVATGLSNLSLNARDRAKYDDAEQLAREALAIRRAALGGTHPQIANSLMSLGQVLNLEGRNREAEPLMLQALEMRRTLYGEDHPLVDVSMNNLASLRQDVGDLAGAEPLYRTALAHQRRRLGPTHPDVAVPMNNLASLLEERGQLGEAETLYRESLAIRRLGGESPAVGRALHNLARMLWKEHKLADAEPLAREALALRTKLLGAAHVETGGSLALIGNIRAAAGDRREGEALLRRALDVQRAAVKADHPTVQATSFDLAVVLLDAGRAEEAVALLRPLAAARKTRLPEGHWLRAYTDVTLGRALLASGRTDEAKHLIEPGYQALGAALPPDDARVRMAADVRKRIS